MSILYSLIRQGCEFQKQDAVFDLCCGNGRLGSEFFDEIETYIGVDLSEVLIDIAKANFEDLPEISFCQEDILSFLENATGIKEITKALIYSSIQYFKKEDVVGLLAQLRNQCPRLQRLFAGSVPDADMAGNFYGDRGIPSLEDHTSGIGCWYERSEFARIANSAGYSCEFQSVPPDFYQSHYRFNAILIPIGL